MWNLANRGIAANKANAAIWIIIAALVVGEIAVAFSHQPAGTSYEQIKLLQE